MRNFENDSRLCTCDLCRRNAARAAGDGMPDTADGAPAEDSRIAAVLPVRLVPRLTA